MTAACSSSSPLLTCFCLLKLRGSDGVLRDRPYSVGTARLSGGSLSLTRMVKRYPHYHPLHLHLFAHCRPLPPFIDPRMYLSLLLFRYHMHLSTLAIVACLNCFQSFLSPLHFIPSFIDITKHHGFISAIDSLPYIPPSLLSSYRL